MMNPARWESAKRLFHDALERPPAERDAFVREAAAGDAELRDEVVALLTAHTKADAAFGEVVRPSSNVSEATPALPSGTRLGPYEIDRLIGAGGMGEVYRARDTRLDRTVAIKVLPAYVSADPQARARFEREARAVSSLNHPHICTLHDIGHHEGIDFLVMEHLDGETLAARLTKGPLPIAQSLQIGIEIASALDRAHRAGIVHRDLKPGNIFLVRGGGSAPPTAKLLDFGLAKTTAPIGATAATGVALTSGLTTPGMILGTVQYMAPEQVEGKAADARSDIWALGAVLYEMVTGTRPFAGDTPASVIGSILKDDPAPVSNAQPLSPRALDRVIAACLTKDPDRRWQSAADLKRQLEWLQQPDLSSPTVDRGGRRRWLPWLGMAATAVAVGTLLALTLTARRAAGVTDTIRLQVGAPPGTTFVTTTSSIPAIQLALAPDGRKLAFVAVEAGRPSMIWIRSFDDDVSHLVAGSEDGSYPFWSPDSRSLAFFARGKLRRTDPGKSEPRDVTDALEPRGGTWLRGDTMVFSGAEGGVFRVPAAGGAAERLAINPGQGSDRWPRALPDGRHLLYLARRPVQSERGVFALSLDGGSPTRLLPETTPVVYAPPGYLLYLQGRTLFAQRFDPRSLTLSGDLAAIATPVAATSTFYGSFDASDNGVIAYGSPLSSPGQLSWYSRTGQRLETVATRRDYIDFDLSPDGQGVLVSRIDAQTGTADVWLLDLRRGSESRVTSDSSVTGAAVWSPDGSHIAFRSNRDGLADMYMKAPSGIAPDELLARGTAVNPTSWTVSDRIVFHDTAPRTGWDIWQFDLTERRRVPRIQTAFNEIQGQLSPDGRWLAYTSDESGRWEVYVQPEPSTGAKWPISTGGGFEPRWTRDGKELMFLTPGHEIMTAPIVSRPAFEAGVPQRLFVAPMDAAVVSPYHRHYAISPDASRILINEQSGDASSGAITVVLNWTAALTK